MPEEATITLPPGAEELPAGAEELLPPIESLGVTPLAVSSPLITPVAAQQGTQFYSPLISGAPGYVMGAALLNFRFDVSYTTGGFDGTAPGAKLVFPPGTILTRFLAARQVAFTFAGSLIRFGTTPTGAEFGSLALDATGLAEQAPLILLPTNRTLYVSLLMTGSTAGAASIAIVYSGAPAARWK